MSLVLWSGGSDSTVALILEAEKASAESPVRAMAINTDWLPDAQVKNQIRTRKKLQKILKAHYGSCIKFMELNIGAEDNYVPSREYGIVQQPFWVAVGAFYVKNEEDLVVGAVSGDDIWVYRTEIHNVYYNILNCMGKTGELRYPLTYWHKVHVWNALKIWGLKDYVWYCESITGKKPCGKCAKCLEIEVIEFQLEHNFIERLPYTTSGLDEELRF